jgi:hypothetical protein
MRSVRVYRALTRLYPPRFRREYGDSMEQLFRDRLHDDGSRRAWGNALRDLTTSAPRQHWESYMHATNRTRLVIAAIVTSAAAILFISLGGAILGLGLLVLLAWELYAILRTRGHRLAAHTWWKFIAGGIALFGALLLIFAVPWPQDWRSSVDGELAWFAGMLGFSGSLVLFTIGLFLGVAHWVTRRDHRTAA